MTEPLKGDYRCAHCGKWALAEHSFAEMLTCIYGGLPTKDGDPWDRHDSEAVVERLAKDIDE